MGGAACGLSAAECTSHCTSRTETDYRFFASRSPPSLDLLHLPRTTSHLPSTAHPRRSAKVPLSPFLDHRGPRRRRHRVARRHGSDRSARQQHQVGADAHVRASALDAGPALPPLRLHDPSARICPDGLREPNRHSRSQDGRTPLARFRPRNRRTSLDPRVVLGRRAGTPRRPPSHIGQQSHSAVHQLPRHPSLRLAHDERSLRAQRLARSTGQLAPRHLRDRTRPRVLPQPPYPRSESSRDALRRSEELGSCCGTPVGRWAE